MSPLPSSSIRRSIGRPRLGGKTGTVPSVYPAGGSSPRRGGCQAGRRATQRSNSKPIPTTSRAIEATSRGDGPAGGADVSTILAPGTLSGGSWSVAGAWLGTPRVRSGGAADPKSVAAGAVLASNGGVCGPVVAAVEAAAAEAAGDVGPPVTTPGIADAAPPDLDPNASVPGWPDKDSLLPAAKGATAGAPVAVADEKNDGSEARTSPAMPRVTRPVASGRVKASLGSPKRPRTVS